MSTTTTINALNMGGPALDASIIKADATATTLLANCEGSHNDYNCVFNATYIVGPWAQATPPPSASTGVFDLKILNPPFTGSNEPASISTALGENDKIWWTYSVHCDMTDYTVPSVCTTTNVGGANRGSTIATISGSSSIEDIIGPFTALPLAVTAGYAKLAAATTTGSSGAASTGSASGIAVAPGSGGKSNSTSTGVHSATLTGSGGVAVSTGGASSIYGINMGTLGLLGLVAAYFVR
ncbi:hypothetical protein K461DRAFT_303867 [Myriangium duriaei CBS 260.36]|uniref:Uncharacterized protein n=1 Tax=Myriangium duriaei CBS 260.36 TaxID=1168546 RepID=A0A9P4J493_9PEZI|nr:hypothetical protein K461DRAFT_303867 [Myriangium duriaei CBS 260.36]